jgi:hypothetical protein
MVDIQLNAQGKTILAGKSTGTVSSSFWDASLHVPTLKTDDHGKDLLHS